RQGGAWQPHFECVAILRSPRPDSNGRADVPSVAIGLGEGCREAGDCQRPREVVIEVHAKHTGTHERALEMMPVVIGHEKLSAVTRVVVTVRTPFITLDPVTAVCTGPRSELADVRGIPARQVERRGERNRAAGVDGGTA